jgi:sugar lactone lactonase YvrE
MRLKNCRPRTHKSTKRNVRRVALVIAFASLAMVMATTAFASLGFNLSWGMTGTERGQFLSPTGIAADSFGNVYVAEGGGSRVQKFDVDGNFLRQFGGFGDVDGGFLSPSGVAVDHVGRVYITDSATNRVSKFGSNGTFFTTWGATGSSSGKFNGASGIAVDSGGDIYVSDANNHRIQRFDSGGVFIAKWGSFGSDGGQLNTPQGIAIDSLDNVYVADTGNNRIEKFSTDGTFLAQWGIAGTGTSEFMGPSGVSIDNAGIVIVADTGNNRIQTFSDSGVFIESFGTAGAGNGQFSAPQDISADALGNVYVADTENDRVQRLSTATPVVADAGPDQFLECGGSITPVTLDGTASSGSGSLSYTWKEGANILGTGATLSTSLPGGSHMIILTVASSDGGSADDEVVINIADNSAPSLSLSGPNPMTVECHTSFTDPGATASDGCAGDLTASIVVSGSVNANAVGSYVLTYSVSDGPHSVSQMRTVNVVDTIPPVLTLNGANPMTVECHSRFVDPGATASDSCGGNLTSAITVSGSVNPNVVGTYVLTYSVTSGTQTTSASRIVRVMDTTPPAIILNGLSPTMSPADKHYDTFSVTDFVTAVTDSCATNLSVSSVVIAKVTSDESDDPKGQGNTSIVIGSNCRSVQLRADRDGSGNGRVYTITFRVTDPAGNRSTATAKVTAPKGRGQTTIDDGPRYTATSSCQ